LLQAKSTGNVTALATSRDLTDALLSAQYSGNIQTTWSIIERRTYDVVGRLVALNGGAAMELGPREWGRWTNLGLAAFFGFLSTLYCAVGGPGWGTDARLYLAATRLWLSGSDPWTAIAADGTRYAAPPPSLLPYAPFVWLPPDLFATLMIIADVAAIVWVVRRLALPWYFVLFPPFVEGTVPGSIEPLMVACLVAGHPVTEALAACMKIYAIVPLALRLRGRSLVLFGAVLLATAFLLPWGTFIADWPSVNTALDSASRIGAANAPILVPFAIVALVSLGRERAAWLAVPTLWPHTQLHYALIALPAMTPLIALAAAMPISGAMQAGVIVAALVLHRWRLSGLARRVAETSR
jgi:hypothetical protein